MASQTHSQSNGKKPPLIATTQNQREQLWMEVVDFLKSLNFDEYIDVFESEGFDRMDALYDMNMDDFRDMKIKRGHAKILLYQIEQFKHSSVISPNKKVRFGVSSTNTSPDIDSNAYQNTSTRHMLPIVNEDKHESPARGNEITPTPSEYPQPHNGALHRMYSNQSNASSMRFSGSQQQLKMVNNHSGTSASGNYHHAMINTRNNLQAPTPHGHDNQFSGSDSSRSILMRSVSGRSDESQELEMNETATPHAHDHKALYRARSRTHSNYTAHSPNHSLSDNGTVVVRGGSVDPHHHHLLADDDPRSMYSHSHYGSTGTVLFNPMSPGGIPRSPSIGGVRPPSMSMADMHNDLNQLIVSLQDAKCENNGNYDEFHEALVNVTTNWDRPKSEKTLKYMNAKENYSNYVILDLLGVLNAQLGQTEEAVKYHTEAITKSGNKYIEAMHNYAYLLHRIGDKENDLLSVKYYKLALSINSKFAHCWLHYGNLLEDEGKLKDAANMYKKAISLRPQNAAFHLDLANVLDDLNDFENASKHYLECIHLQPNDPVYHWNYAISLENQCFYYKAEEAYKRAISLDFHCIDAHMNYAHMLENQPTPQYKKALREYEVILTMPGMESNTEMMLKCAKLYDHFGDHEKTEFLYMNILQIDPTMEDTYILFAQYLTNQNRIEDANACYQAGLRHVQTPKLQEQYIQFLKDINTIYNKQKPSSSASTHTNAGFKQKLTKINTNTNNSNATQMNGHHVQNGVHPPPSSSAYVPPSPFVTTVYQTQFSPRAANNNNNNGTYFDSNAATVTTPSYDEDIAGFSDYYRPAKANKSNKNNNNNNRNGSATTHHSNNAHPNQHTNGKASAAQTKPTGATEEGCIVM